MDSRYESSMVSRLLRSIMVDGKVTTARDIVYKGMVDSCESLPKNIELPEHSTVREKELLVLEKALAIITPRVEVKSRRFGGANYQVPVEVSQKRQHTLAVRWILEAVRGRSGMPTHLKLAQEIIDCYNKTGSTIQKRENTHRLAEANKAFSHFRW